MEKIINTFNRILDPVKKRIFNIICRGLVENIEDSTKMQLLQVSGVDRELLSKVEHIEPAGITHVPVVGDEVLLLKVNGDSSESIAVIVGSSQNRPISNEAGSTTIWNNNGDIIKLTSGKIEIICTTGEVEINAKDVTVNLEAGGQLNVANGNLTVEA